MTMFEPGSSFWRWLADQPAFIEVGVGMCFVLIIAPAVLTAVAVACTQAEILVESFVADRLMVPSSRPSHHQSKRRLSVAQDDRN
jgi:hypothetical protein